MLEESESSLVGPMSIIDRLNLLIRAELGALTGGRRSDPAALRAAVGEARVSLASLTRSRRELNERYQDRLDAAARAEEDAVAALRRRDEAAAHSALARKQRLEREAESLRTERDGYERQLVQLRGTLDGLRTEVAAERARRGGPAAAPVRPSNRSRPPVRPTAIDARPAAGDLADHPASDALTGDVFDRFEEVESRLSELAAEVAAEAALSESFDELGAPGDAALERKFSELEHDRSRAQSESADDALSRLRRRINDDEE